MFSDVLVLHAPGVLEQLSVASSSTSFQMKKGFQNSSPSWVELVTLVHSGKLSCKVLRVCVPVVQIHPERAGEGGGPVGGGDRRDDRRHRRGRQWRGQLRRYASTNLPPLRMRHCLTFVLADHVRAFPKVTDHSPLC